MQVRESRDVFLTAIGIDAVGIAIRAVCFARLYLQVSKPPSFKTCCPIHVLPGCLRFSCSYESSESSVSGESLAMGMVLNFSMHTVLSRCVGINAHFSLP